MGLPIGAWVQVVKSGWIPGDIEATEQLTMQPKSDAITAIMKLNPSANPAFLARFSSEELHEYLDRLHTLPGMHADPGIVRQVDLGSVFAGEPTTA